MEFLSFDYEVLLIDGDYVHLNKIGAIQDPKIVARALLPQEIREGSILHYEMMQYELTKY